MTFLVKARGWKTMTSGRVEPVHTTGWAGVIGKYLSIWMRTIATPGKPMSCANSCTGLHPCSRFVDASKTRMARLLGRSPARCELHPCTKPQLYLGMG